MNIWIRCSTQYCVDPLIQLFSCKTFIKNFYFCLDSSKISANITNLTSVGEEDYEYYLKTPLSRKESLYGAWALLFSFNILNPEHNKLFVFILCHLPPSEGFTTLMSKTSLPFVFIKVQLWIMNKSPDELSRVYNFCRFTATCRISVLHNTGEGGLSPQLQTIKTQIVTPQSTV